MDLSTIVWKCGPYRPEERAEIQKQLGLDRVGRVDYTAVLIPYSDQLRDLYNRVMAEQYTPVTSTAEILSESRSYSQHLMERVFITEVLDPPTQNV